MRTVDDFDHFPMTQAARAVWSLLSSIEQSVLVFRVIEACLDPSNGFHFHPDLKIQGRTYSYFTIELKIAELLCLMPTDGGLFVIAGMSVDRDALREEVQPPTPIAN